jgi:hypothetical protein
MTRCSPLFPRALGAALAAGALLAACANGVETDTAFGVDTVVDAGRRDSGPGTGEVAGDTGVAPPPDAGNSGHTTGPLGGGGDAGGTADAGTATSTDSGPPPVVDSGPPPVADSGPTPVVDSGPPPGPTCAPKAPASFSALWHPKKGVSGDCIGTEIADFYAACMDTGATQAKCSAYANGLSSSYCYDCIVSAPTETTWGALINYTTATELNVGGCYAIEGASSACSHAVPYKAECEEAYCGTTCGKTDADYTACIAVADGAGGGCATYATSVTTSCAGLAASIKAACDPTTDFKASFTSVANVFCGR